MAGTWTHIRIRQTTKERLESFLRSLLVAHDQSKLNEPAMADRLPTADDAIRILLDRDQGKRERVRKAKAKARQAKSRGEATQSTGEG